MLYSKGSISIHATASTGINRITQLLLLLLAEGAFTFVLENLDDNDIADRFEQITAGLMDSVIGYPSFFSRGQHSELLEASQTGEILLEKTPAAVQFYAAPSTTVLERVNLANTAAISFVQSSESLQTRLPEIDLEKLLSVEVCESIAARCLYVGIRAGLPELPPNVVAVCTESSNPKIGYYISGQSRLSKALRLIGRGVVRA